MKKLFPFVLLLFSLRVFAQEVTVQENADGVSVAFVVSQKTQNLLIQGAKPAGFIPLGQPAEPAIYAKSFRVAIPRGSDVTLRIMEQVTKTRSGGLPLFPSTGKVGAGFKPAPTYPTELVHVSLPKVFRQVEYVDVRINPVHVNVRGHRLTLLEHVRFELVFSKRPGNRIEEHESYSRMYERLFVNSWKDKGEVESNRIQQSLTWQPPAHSGNVYKINVRTDGIYQLSHSFLNANTNWQLNSIDPHFFRIFNQGVEVPIFVSGEADGNFNAADAINFYGAAFTGENDSGVWQKGDFTDENVYWILVGTQPGARMSTRNVAPANIYPTPTSFISTIHLEQNPIFAPFHTVLDTDLFTWKLAYWPGSDNSQAVQHHNNMIPSISTDSSFQCSLLFESRGRTYKDADPDHHVLVKVNNNLIGEIYLDAYEVRQDLFTFSQNLLGGPGTTAIDVSHEVTDPVLLGIDADAVASNWFKLTYSRTLEAYNDQLAFHFDTGSFQFAIPGFTSNKILLFDVSAPASPILLTAPMIQSQGGFFGLSFQDVIPTGGEDYLASVPMNVSSNDFILDVPSDLQAVDPTTNWILIAPQAWISEPGVQNLRNFRQSQGLMSQVVAVDDIYDEYNFGIVSPYAVKNFLQSVYNSSNPPKLQYVVLVGDADWDYKDYANDGNYNLLPTYMVPDPGFASPFHVLAIHSFDNYYGCFSGTDSIPEILIGRVPARTPIEVNDSLGKILFYETGITDHSWLGNNLFGSDCQDYLDFELQQDINAAYLQPDPPYQATKKYFRLPPWNCSTKDGNGNGISDVIEELNAGQAVSSWIGHGSFQQWGFNSFVDVADMSDLSNATKPTVMLNANCFTGAFYHAVVQSLMEAFLLGPGGMVSGFAPGTYMFSFQSGFVTEPFYADAFGLAKERNLGLLFQRIYLELDSTGETRLTQGMVELGDPATRLAIPAEQAPQNFQVSLTGCDQIQLIWSAPLQSYTGAYSVYRSTNVSGPFARINFSPVFDTSYTDAELSAGITYYYYVVAVDADGFEGTATQILSEQASNPPMIILSPTILPDGLQGTAYNQLFTASGGTAPYTFTISGGILPTGLSLSSDGTLAGTPTSSGTFVFTVTAATASGCVGNQGYTLNITPVCLFCDDFEDAILSSQWTYQNGTWSEAAGALTGNHNKKANAIASPVFSGCTLCAVATTVSTTGGTGNKVYMLGWYVDKKNAVELIMNEERDKWILKQRVGGSVVAKAKVMQTIDPNVSYDVQVVFDGTQFQLFLSGNLILTMPKAAGTNPAGTVGFRIKGTTADFERIFVQ